MTSLMIMGWFQVGIGVTVKLMAQYHKQPVPHVKRQLEVVLGLSWGPGYVVVEFEFVFAFGVNNGAKTAVMDNAAIMVVRQQNH